MVAVKLKSSHTPHFEMTKAIDFKLVESEEKYGFISDKEKVD